MSNIPNGYDEEGNVLIPSSKLKTSYVGWEERMRLERDKLNKEKAHDIAVYKIRLEIKRLSRIEYLENLEANGE